MRSSSPPCRKLKSLVLAAAGCCLPVTWCQAKLPAPDGGEMVVIDVHTHVFNGHDLPLEGILASRGAGPVLAASLAKLLNAMTRDDMGARLPAGPTPPAAPESAEQARRSALAAAEVNAPAAGRDSLFSLLTPEEQRELVEFAYSPGPNKAATAPAAPEEPPAGGVNTNELEVIARALEKLDFPPSEHEARATTAAATAPAGAPGAGVNGYLQFLGAMIKGNQQIARLLQSEYPAVDLFVHHMMDMERAYASKPVVLFEAQTGRMKRLDEWTDGRLVHFVAFDPFRREEALPSALRGIEAGALGFKFYPPSGYRAAQNKALPRPPWWQVGARSRWDSRYQGYSPAMLDATIDAFFTECEKRDLPIFTHCTPGGFEAEKGYGEMADPQFWALALKEDKHPRLRVCFGHSGGEAYWFPSAQPTEAEKLHAKFGETVVNLCLTRPNVYCEVGYLENILQPGEPGRFAARLKELVDKKSPDGTWSFGDKLMYGTDWHMVHKERAHREFPKAFLAVFNADPALQKWARAFFARNAIKYLKLADAAGKKELYSQAQRDRWTNLIRQAGP